MKENQPLMILRLAYCLLCVGSLLLAGCAADARRADHPKADVVDEYIAALNKRDLLLLTAYVTPDVEWRSVVNGEAILEVAGRDALKSMLEKFFAQHERTHWS